MYKVFVQRSNSDWWSKKARHGFMSRQKLSKSIIPTSKDYLKFILEIYYED